MIVVVALEVPDAGGDFVDQIVIVSDQQHRALVRLQRDVERVDGFEVEVVRRFVEHEHIRLLQHELAEEQSRGFATGEHVGLLVAVVAREEHLAEQSTDFFGRSCAVPTMQPLEHGHALLDQELVVLREIADGSFMSPDNLAVVNKRAIVAAGGAKF